jgi:hypothetical protein
MKGTSLFATKHAPAKDALSLPSSNLGRVLLELSDVLAEDTPLEPWLDLKKAEKREDVGESVGDGRSGWEEEVSATVTGESGRGQRTQSPAVDRVELCNGFRDLSVAVANVLCR